MGLKPQAVAVEMDKLDKWKVHLGGGKRLIGVSAWFEGEEKNHRTSPELSKWFLRSRGGGGWSERANWS